MLASAKHIISVVLLINTINYCLSKKIAIVGGGIGGAASAYFLRQLVQDCDLDVFEAGQVGGRLKVIDIGGHQYEEGGAIIHSRNRHMQSFIKDLGLKHRDGQAMGKLGFFDGKEMIFTESDSSIITQIKLLWRYGFSLFNINGLTSERLDKFDSIYDYQDKEMSFKTLDSLLEAMSPQFVKATQTSAQSGFLNEGLSERVIKELVGSSVRINYGQDVRNVHELLGFVCMAAADGNLWAVNDGNYQVPVALINASQANLIPHRVLRVNALDSDQYELTWKNGGELKKEIYDAVVIATPITDELKHKIDMPDLINKIPSRHMQRLFVTFVQGAVNLTSFGLTKEDKIDEFVGVWDNQWFNSLSRVHPVDGSELKPDEIPVFKVFSSAPLTNAQLDFLFSKRVTIEVRDWFPYPIYSYNDPIDVLHFDLRPGLFYLNAIEWAASAMEMSAVSAKNVALLTRNFLYPDKEIPFARIASSGNRLEL